MKTPMTTSTRTPKRRAPKRLPAPAAQAAHDYLASALHFARLAAAQLEPHRATAGTTPLLVDVQEVRALLNVLTQKVRETAPHANIPSA